MNKGMTLVADSGSTKTDWALGQKRMTTPGINPFHQDEPTIRRILVEELLPQIGTDRVETIAFYGSGVRPELEPLMERLLGEAFPSATKIEAHGDLLAAARALLGHEAGIACILGTGSNSCLYDGEHITANTPPLGYILGDEGSGAVLGRRFLNMLYRCEFDEDLSASFEAWSGMSMADVINRVYRQPLANRWLAGLSSFIHNHLDNASVHELVVDNFRQFIRHCIQPYASPCLPLTAVGSIAFHYRTQLTEAAAAEGYVMGQVLPRPIDSLALFIFSAK